MPILTHNGKVLKYQSPKQIIVTNGGGIGTTDWVDSNSDGLADNWRNEYIGGLTYSIVSGNGFSGNAQRCIASGGAPNYGISYGSKIIVKNKSYKVTFKTRLSITNDISGRLLLVIYGAAQTFFSVTSNQTGNPDYYEATFTALNDGYLMFYSTSTRMSPGDWFEVDEINVQEIYNYNVLEHGYGDDFVFTINTALGTGASLQLPFRSGYNNNFTVRWGDGTSSKVTSYNDPNAYHAYAEDGIYQVRISGLCESWYFNNAGDKLKIISVDIWGNTGFKSLTSAFYGCSNLQSIPNGPISANSSTTMGLSYMFMNCINLDIELNENLFINFPNIEGVSFYQIFNGCVKLHGSIPENLFKYNTKVTTYSFTNTFYNCTGLTGSIPENLFKYNVVAQSIEACFYGCSGLTGSIPQNLFRYNDLRGAGLRNVFSGCSGLTGQIPVDLFRYNTLVTYMSGVFNGCTGLSGQIPEDLFYYNNLVTDYSYALRNCKNLILPTRLFNLSNLSIVTTFWYFMALTTETDSYTGTIQDIWNYAPSAVHTYAFYKQTALSNYASIPNDWKGL